MALRRCRLVPHKDLNVRCGVPKLFRQDVSPEYAREFRELGYEGWRDKYTYGKRWYSEGTFSAVKRKCGECVHATKVKNMFNEVKLKYLFYNAILKYDETHGSLFASLV
jgi:hypothetical protein